MNVGEVVVGRGDDDTDDGFKPWRSEYVRACVALFRLAAGESASAWGVGWGVVELVVVVEG